MTGNQASRNGHGGRRAGAGRPKGSKTANARNASFEAARPGVDRPRVMIASLDPKREVSAWDRRTLIESGRWAVNNSGIAARIVRGTANFALGPGLVPQAQTRDHAWNRAAEMWFEDSFCNVPWAFDLGGQFDFYRAQVAIVEAMLTDGEVFSQLALSKDGHPMMRFRTAEAVGAGIYGKTDSERVVDGVRTNVEGAPMAYAFLEPGKTEPRWIPADDVIHVFRPHRIGALRGVSWLGTAVARVQDILKMDNTELAAAMLNAKVAFTIESENAGNIGLGSHLRKEIASDAQTEIKRDVLIDGAGSLQLKPGEKMHAHEFNRPNSNYIAFRDALTRELAYSVGVSPEIIWNMAGLGGTASRQALIDADTFFGSIRRIVEYSICMRFWRFAIWRAIKAGILAYPGDDWHRVAWVGPQKLTVDNGRDGRLRLELVRAGLLSRRQYFNELGQDAEQQTEDIIRDAARRKKMIERIAAEEGVTLTEQEVFPPAPGAAPTQPAREPDLDKVD